MFTPRSGHLARCLSRCWSRDFTALTAVFAPRGARPDRPTDRPAQPAATPVATHRLGSEGPLPATQTTIQSVTHTGSVLNLAQEPKPQPLTEGSTEAKALYKTLVTSSPEDVILMVARGHARMNKVHYALALKSLFRVADALSKDELRDFTRELHEDEGFQVLVSLVALKGQHYEAGVAADMLRFMCVLGLDSDHPALQVYMQLIKYHLNDLDLEMLVRLMHSLTSLTVTSQTQLLQKAIGLLCNLRANQVPILNTWQLVTLLEQCGGTLEPPVLQAVLEQLLDGPEQLSARLAAAVLRGLSRADPALLAEPPLTDPAVSTLTLCMDRLHTRLDKLSLEDTLEVITSMEQLGVQDEDFYDAVGRRSMEEGTSVEDMLTVLEYFQAQRYHHRDLVCGFKERLAGRGATECDMNLQQMVKAIRILAETSNPGQVLKPESRPPAERALVKELCRRIVEDSSHLSSGEVQECMVDLVVLGETPLLDDQGTSPAVLQSADSPTLPDTTSLLWTLHQMELLPSPSSEQHHEMKIKQMGRALRQAIQDCPPLTVHEDNPLSFVIDYLVVVNPDSSVPTVSERDHNLEPGLLAGRQAVAIVILNDNSYHRNTGQLKGRLLLCGRLLQKEGYLVQFVNHDEWCRMDEKDMIPYLARCVNNIHNEQDLHVL